MPKPKAIAADSSPWLRTTALLYGKQRTIYYKTLCGQWYRVWRARLVRIVIVRVDDGDLALRVFFSTNPSISVRALLEGYAGTERAADHDGEGQIDHVALERKCLETAGACSA